MQPQKTGDITPQAQSADPCKTLPAKDISLTESTPLLFHIHPLLTIIILGNVETIPDNVGRSDTVMWPIHTHDSSGMLHVESACVRDYTLGDFFDIWGKRFNSTCILDRCNDGNHMVSMYVNGAQSYEFGGLVLKDAQVIVIKYE